MEQIVRSDLEERLDRPKPPDTLPEPVEGTDPLTELLRLERMLPPGDWSFAAITDKTLMLVPNDNEMNPLGWFMKCGACAGSERRCGWPDEEVLRFIALCRNELRPLLEELLARRELARLEQDTKERLAAGLADSGRYKPWLDLELADFPGNCVREP